MSEINQLDLAFIVDTTGSMGGLIQAAQRRMIDTVGVLAKAATVDVRLAVVEYRDHPPQDSLVFRVHPFSGDLRKARKYVESLRADGGGDEPEAVLAGIAAACRDLSWRPHARRLGLLVGDAPPHGVGCPGDAFARACPSGETVESVTAKAEKAGVTVHALGLRRSCHESFERIARLTGGRFYREDRGGDAMNEVQRVLDGEFGQLGFDRQVHEAWEAAAGADVERIAERLGTTPPKVASAVCRLQSRGLLLSEPPTVS